MSHLSRRLLKVRGHLYAALIEQTKFAEEQSQLAQVLLQFPETVLIRCLTLRHTIRQLERRRTKKIADRGHSKNKNNRVFTLQQTLFYDI